MTPHHTFRLMVGIAVSLAAPARLQGGRPLTREELYAAPARPNPGHADFANAIPLWPALEPKGGNPSDPLDSSPLALSLPKPTADELESLIPGATTNPRRDSAPPLAPAMLELARKVAPAVVALRSWDAHGNLLARGCGFFIGEHGAILTDMALVHPDLGKRIEYITVTTGLGASHRITGVWTQNFETGFTVLQSDAAQTESLMIHPAPGFADETAVSVVALHDNQGLTLADAWIKADPSPAGADWLILRGHDSPGEPGSPILDRDGHVVALVSMRVPQGNWVNFGIRIDGIAAVLRGLSSRTPQPLSSVAANRLPPVQFDARFIAAFRALHEGRAHAATSQLLKLFKPYPRSAELWNLTGLGFAALGAKGEAASCYRKAVALNPTVGDAWLHLAITQLEGKPNASVREALENAVLERPGDRISWMLLAEQQLLAKKFSEAEHSLLEVLKLEADFAHAAFLLSYVKSQQGNAAEAIAAAERCVRLSPKHARAWFFLGLLYTRQDRAPDALRAYQNVVAIDPAHPHGWRNLALLHRKLGHDAEARVALTRHQRLPPKREK